MTGGVLRYLSHPQVTIDPAIPVPRWSLSETGRGRMLALCGSAWLGDTTAILTSSETKACEAAAILGAASGITPVIDADLDEIDRSATGYVPMPRHEALADAFFACPEARADGWEAATDVAARGMRALRRHVAAQGRGDLLIVGHGGIGTLIWCAVAGLRPGRQHDQPAGGGAVWAARLPDLAPLHGWMPAEEVAALPTGC
ncbi:histidine phosphatase family protein [Paracoccus spongiarum]|uniref:Histidine phosphatase family protein n=1 Tax=Paracoccus spongiarum TaxID=3064387 RepID=A0ABT9JG40_9RHOB|nr:histidine phosphatase family protein [Paracoccus sp. 2205BS29-5]MDP5308763.1 histidine phosphatase family protein [Paracoccus sp. 2205BS29-5]